MRAVGTATFGRAGMAAGLALLLPGAAHATATVVAPGGEYTLPADLMLTGADSLTAGDAAGARCKIHGGGHTIRTIDTPWTGALTIVNCDVDGLGVAGGPAMDVQSSAATVVIQGSTFSRSGQLSFGTFGSMGVTFQRNTIAADSLVPAVKLAPDSQDAFRVTGASTGARLFQGNTILKATVTFVSTSGWLVGGDTPADGNVLVGLRAGIALGNASDMIIRGNYSHTFRGDDQCTAEGRPEDCWNQVKNFALNAGGNNLVEHNVFRGLNWLLELNGGVEVRYNLLVDNTERGWVLLWSKVGARVHHNVLVVTREDQEANSGGFVLEEGDPVVAPDAEIFNNTLDAGGVCNPAIGGAVVLHDLAVLASLRSNAFVGVRLANAGTTLVRTTTADPSNPLPARLGYSDYNLFSNPDAPVNYGVGVAGKTARVDPGFGYADVPVGGKANAQVDPKFAAPDRIPRSFPYSDDQLIAGQASACQVLAYYRQAYAPASDSPLVDRGDPQDGSGNDIGAVGAGLDNQWDHAATASDAARGFGRLCDPADIGQPALGADIFKCPAVPPGGNPTGAGGSTGTPGQTPHGITCVCAVGSGGPQPGALALAAAAVALALARRRTTEKRPTRRTGS